LGQGAEITKFHPRNQRNLRLDSLHSRDRKRLISSFKRIKMAQNELTLPEPFNSIPRTQLLFPQFSPIEKLDRLTAALNPGDKKSVDTHYWIKREDCNSGLASGGNKVL
jgi:hypothetical protein